MSKSFAAHPPKIFMQPINDQGGGNYRILQPASLLRRYGYAMTQAHPMAVKDEQLQVLNPDVVVFQLFQTQKQQERIQRYRKALPNAHFVYEIDDLFWAVPKDSFHQNNPLLATSRSNIRTTAKLCNTITVTTPELAEEMRKLTNMKDIRVVPNHVPLSFINAAIAGRRDAQKAKASEISEEITLEVIPMQPRRKRIGWAGGIGHGGDLKILPPIMEAFGDEIQWVFLGMLPQGVAPGPNVEYHQGVPFPDYAHKLGNLNLDLALAPLEHNDFNRCKSDLRILEYAAAGYPVLASDGPTYKDCPVIKCGNAPQLWINTIQDLLSKPDDLDAYAEHLHAWVNAERCMDKNLRHYAASYLPKNVEPFVPQNIQKTNGLVTVGAKFEGVSNFDSIAEAWSAAPGTDILYVRSNTVLNENQAARLVHQLGNNASVAPLTNDGMYPEFGRFTQMPADQAENLDAAAMVTQNEPILAPFPAGPVVVMSGQALARYGLPDASKFGNIEYAMADWGARCMEGGSKHITAANTFVYTHNPLVQGKNDAQRTLEHLSMWMPGFTQVLQAYQQGNALANIREDLDLAYNSLAFTAPQINSYQEWYELFQSVNDADRQAMAVDVAKWKTTPKISIIMPTYNTPVQFLTEAIQSVLLQSYPNWEFIIADDASTTEDARPVLEKFAFYYPEKIKVVYRETNGHICQASNSALELATGDWVVFLDHDDTLAPHALYMMAREAMLHPEAEFIYSDSDKIAPDGSLTNPYMTPDFSYELLLGQNFVTHLCAYKLDQVKAIGNLKEGLEGSQDWDLVLRYLEAYCGTPPDTAKIRHVHSVLYHWRQTENSTSANIMAKPYALDAARKAIVQHLHRTNQMAFVGQNPIIPTFNLVRFLLPEQHPKVTIIIPTKDNYDQLLRCLGSIFANTVYNNYEIVVLNNGKKPLTAWPKEWASHMQKVRVIAKPGEFNYAAFNNRAVFNSDAEFVCLMNDDVEAIERAWLMDMVGLAKRDKVGAVGAKLLYPNDRIQCAGIIFSPDQAPGQSSLHMWQQLGAFDPGQVGRAVITQPTIAVTGACMVIKRSLYMEMEGMDEIRFPMDYNDVDLCLRLHKKGYRNIVAAQSIMRHHEGYTKKRTNTWRLEQMLAAERELLKLHSDVRDPYIHPSLVFHPALSMLSRNPPERPWLESDNRERVLVVNGGAEKAHELFKQGKLPFSVTTEGHFLAFQEPSMPAVRPVDLREDVQPLSVILSKLNIDKVMLCAIGDGTLGMLGYFATLAENGVPVQPDFKANGRDPNKHGYYTDTAWRSMWQHFAEAINPHEDTANVDMRQSAA